MQIVIGNVLSTEELRLVRAALRRARFVDGAATAGFAARLVKNNRQAEGSDRSLGTIRKLVAERVLGNEVFRLAVRPKALSPLLFSRYEKGMRYGSHVDDALMDGMRTDVSRSPSSCPSRKATTAASSRSKASRARKHSNSMRGRWLPIPPPRCITSAK